MLKENDKIKVHFYDYNYSDHIEIKTRIFNNVFRVYENGGKLGFDYNTERSPYTCKAVSLYMIVYVIVETKYR